MPHFQEGRIKSWQFKEKNMPISQGRAGFTTGLQRGQDRLGVPLLPHSLGKKSRPQVLQGKVDSTCVFTSHMLMVSPAGPDSHNHGWRAAMTNHHYPPGSYSEPTVLEVHLCTFLIILMLWAPETNECKLTQPPSDTGWASPGTRGTTLAAGAREGADCCI